MNRKADLQMVREKSDEVQTQYRDEAARIEDQKQRSAEMVQSTVNAAIDNRAVTAEANFRQAIQNAQAVENAVYQQLGSPADGINYNRLNGVPLHLHADIVRTTQEVVKARDAYLATHPEERDNPALQVHIGEDGLAKYGARYVMSRRDTQTNPRVPDR